MTTPGSAPPRAARPRRRPRPAAGAAVTLLFLVVAWASPALAADDVSSTDPAHWSPLVAFAVFGLIPLSVAAVIYAIVYGTRSRHGRYRPGLSWDYAPLWFGAPDDPDAALDEVESGSATAAGGASAVW